jgi:defect-in-organelle-trafficking protein DotD
MDADGDFPIRRHPDDRLPCDLRPGGPLMRPTHLRRLLALSAAVLSLSACAQQQTANIATVPYDPALRGEVEQQLSASAARSANALETLSMIQRARTAPAAPTLDETSLPDELRRKATVEFNGPAIEIARELAANIGYGFIETGNPPAVEGLVNIDEHDVSVAKALEDVGLQAQRFATVIVDPNLRRVEFRNETAMGGPPHARIDARVVTERRARLVTRHHVHVAASCNCMPAPARSGGYAPMASGAAPQSASVAPVHAPAGAPVAASAPAASSGPAAVVAVPGPMRMPTGMVPVSPNAN